MKFSQKSNFSTCFHAWNYKILIH